MKNTYLLLKFLLYILVIIVVYSCSKLYVDNTFRKTYQDINEVIHNDSLNKPFFKVHLKNGDVNLVEQWELNESKDSIVGQGKIYDFNRNQIHVGNFSYNIDEIAIIETNQLDAIKSKDKSRIAGLTVLTAINAMVDVLCITNPKSCFGSCPTFYINKNVIPNCANAEGFSSSISPSLERRDLDALQFSTTDNEFCLTMTNEAFETHLINELFIQAVSKEKNKNIFHDKDGVFYNCNELSIPNQIIVEGNDVGNLTNKIDDNEYYSSANSSDLATKEEIILEFKNLVNFDKGLVLNFRQSLLTTFLLYSGISYMGNEVGDYFAMIETNKHVKKRLSNPFKKLGTIKLFVWDYNKNNWEYCDDIYETGPIAKNLVMIPIPERYNNYNELKLKLELTKGLWRLDFVGLTSINDTIESHSIYPYDIEIINGENYTIDYINKDDENYLVSLPGNKFEFHFKLPKQEKEVEYELFLSSKGYYLEWIRNDWIQTKDLSRLRKMLLNDKDEWVKLAEEFSKVEDEMETVFWNSKYTDLKK